MRVRSAIAADVSEIVSLLELKRKQLQTWAPRFWRRSENAAEMTTAHFNTLISDSSASVLICERDDVLLGCLQFRPSFVPPVYAPGGTTWMVDDFTVRDNDWSEAGEALLKALYAQTIHREPGQLVFPVPVKDEPAQAFFAERGLNPTTTWFTISD